MKTSLLSKFESVVKDLRAFFYAQNPPTKKAPSKKQRSMADSQGVDTFKGSGYKGKGNVDSSKQRLNRKRR